MDMARAGGPEDAARRLFADPRAAVVFSPRDGVEARHAVDEFARLFASAPGVFKDALDGARAGAETLSGDRLQGISEIIQNADDANASYVRFRLVGDRLTAVHDGDEVTLPDVLALATPWLSNKTGNDVAAGRFGIGLMTLRALSDVLDVHSGPYHIRLGDPTISAIEPDGPPSDLTVLGLQVRPGSLGPADLVAWLGRWDDSALLFLRNVREVSVLSAQGRPLRTLRLSWNDDRPADGRIAGHNAVVRRRHAAAPDGRRWLVHSTEVPTPPDVHRVRKAAGVTVPLGLAIALQPGDHGAVYAGLPVVDTAAPLRVNAQFDPVTSRAGLADTAWNGALLPLLADLWVEVVEDLLAEQPAAAWDAIPLPGEDVTADGARSIVADLEELLLDRARTQLATRGALVVAGEHISLADLAVEAADLERVIEPAETAHLAGLTTPFPAVARDAGARWRQVLDDWRDAGDALPPVVTVQNALELLRDADRDVSANIELVAVALDNGLASWLAGLPCVSTSDGRRIAPPTAESVQALMVARSGLAEQLGMGVGLADEHLADTDAARTVLGWLRRTGAVIDDAGNEEVVRRLAAAGQAGQCLTAPLTDDQLRALRDAFEQLPPGDRTVLGRDVGRSVLIAAYRFDAHGQIERLDARPAQIYLSRAIDREPDSFAAAADRTPGLLWTNNRYAEQLRSPTGRVGGLGAQRFLGLLGVERVPRLARHAGLQERYSGRTRGLPAGVAGGPVQRARMMSTLSASYTLNDIDSPDLRAVVADIARERKAKRRRERAGALLGALGRAWDRLADSADVTAADTDYNWRHRGTVKAFWLWSAGAAAWLDDSHGAPRAPLDLRLKTAGTVAVYGPDAPRYLHPDLDRRNRREILAALGVSGEPTTLDLVQRLRRLRAEAPAPPTLATDAAIVYRAIGERLASREALPGDLPPRALRSAFTEGAGLIHTDLGWRQPAQVLAGPPIFRRHHAFAPAVNDAEPLWTALNIRTPSIEDCLRVIRQIAQTRRAPEGDDVGVLLETLRHLRARLASSTDRPQQLGTLSLWTTQGWRSKRPVYAVDDPALVEGLGAEVPVWLPGGEVGQFEALLEPLRISRLRTEATTVVDPARAVRDEATTALFAAAVARLQEDLARNDARTAGMLTVGWDLFGEIAVHVDPGLRVRVDGLKGRGPVEIEVVAKVDVGTRVLYLRDDRLLRQVDGGGRAVAGLFAGADQRHLAQAWLAACVAADDGPAAQPIRLAAIEAAEERARQEQAMAERAADLARDIAGRHQERSRHPATRPAAPATPPVSPGPAGPAGPPPSPPRVLVDPSTLVVLNPDGRAGGEPGVTRTTSAPRRPVGPLPRPDRASPSPANRTGLPAFTALDRESVGLALARKVLAGDEREIADLRAQRGVGADAVDSLERFFELKVYAGDEPDVIRLEESQVRRALSTPDFFLVVVSNIEGADARPKVRIIVDPVRQLPVVSSGAVTLSGVRSAEHSLVYGLGPAPVNIEL
ncbi:hypothetical protein GCM10009827_109930 [Dactylosporangium maewongense]|uniref:Protein NO VEIN C-terminal domain-containing protein n=2 Tax=Dactylosporangium maewongense TaxID=634393 RepID=A0ABP4P4H3_9ACTN